MNSQRPPQTKTQRQYQENKEAYEKASRDLDALAREEFPIGTRVQWIHTFKRNGDAQWLDGTVTHHGYGWRFDIKRDNGTVYSKDPTDLFPSTMIEARSK